MNIPVVYEDDWLLIVDKPSGLLTIPTPKNELRTLTSILNEDLKSRNISYRIHPCHRLDRDTSGLIIFAKGKSTQDKMMELFHKKQIKKTYVAFLKGNLSKKEGIIQNNVDGLSAVTKYRIIEKRKDFTIVEANPLTGRTNQIRIHFKQIGHPILGDTKYAFRRDFQIKTKRLCLHAKSLDFLHPINKKHIKLDSRLPTDLWNFLKSHNS